MTEYWKKLAIDKRSGMINSVVHDWRHYIVGDEDEIGMRGFDGRKVIIKFMDNSTITTTNLWSQGIIPELSRYMFANNAISLTFC